LVTPEGKLVKKALFSLGLIRSLLIVVVVATVVAFLGLRLAEGEPPPPRTGTLSTPVPPDPSPESPVTEPRSSITIAGEEVPLSPQMKVRTTAYGPPGPPGLFTMIEYDADPETPEFSQLLLDADGRIVSAYILPEDLRVYQPLLDAALPQMIEIRAQEVPLPAGATVSGAIAECPPPDLAPPGAGRCSPHPTIVQRGVSFVTFDEVGIIAERIAPEDEADFQPVVDALE
jgi:hypothetical protein